MDKKSLSHTAWKCQYHIVFIPKYKKKKLYGQVRADSRRSSMCGSYTSMCKYSAQAECIKLYGIFEGSEYADDL